MNRIEKDNSMGTMIKRLPEKPSAFDVFAAFPHIYAPWVEYCQQVFRGPGPLSIPLRETIFTYCSQLNECEYCFSTHAAATEAVGGDKAVFDALKADIDGAPVEAKVKPLLKYVRKLTLTPSRMVPGDAEAVYAAGWDDEALHLAIALCCLANFMNRLIEGCGIHADYESLPRRVKVIAEMGYSKPFHLKMAQRQGKAAE